MHSHAIFSFPYGMLSAIAARKSTLAASISTPTPSSVSADTLRTESKAEETTRKKRKRQPARSLVPPPSPPSSSPDEDDDDGKERHARAFISPSQSTSLITSGALSLDDSSADEEGPQDDRPRLAVNGSRHYEPPSATFHPIPGQNTFTLIESELKALDLLCSPSTLNPHFPSPTPTFQGTVLLLHEHEALTLLGACTLTVLLGSVRVAGALLRDDGRNTRHPILAPRCAPLPVIRACAASPSLRTKPQDPALLRRLSARISQVLRDSSAGSPPVVIVLGELSTDFELLGQLYAPFRALFNRIDTDDPQANALGLRGLQMVTEERHHSIRVLRFPPTWHRSLQALVPTETEGTDGADEGVNPPIFLVRGPKNSGKSTFARALVNRLLSRFVAVAFLDCDPGQPEFTPPGMVSLNAVTEPLLGQPFTHWRQPLAAHFIGSTTPRDVPTYYLDALTALMDTYRERVASNPPDAAISGTHADLRIATCTPLVVNTMGWTKGMGADLNARILQIVEPTSIFQLGDSGEHAVSMNSGPHANEMDGALGFAADVAESSCSVHTLESFSTSQPLPSAADNRALSLLTYFLLGPDSAFSSSAGGQGSSSSGRPVLSLSERPPYEVDARVAFDSIVVAGSGASDVKQRDLPRVLNGAIVALIQNDLENGDLHTRPRPELSTAEDLQAAVETRLPDPHTTTCVGLALVRAAASVPSPGDPSNARLLLQILTPLPPTMLGSCRTLVKGTVELPVFCLLDAAKDAEHTHTIAPHLQWSSVTGVGGQRRKQRRNLMRKGQA